MHVQEPRRATAEEGVAVVFRCEHCGERIELRTNDTGTEIVDAPSFLAKHADCLRQRRN